MMDTAQRDAARRAMSDWLAHPNELGKAPARLECAQEFDQDGRHYYIFKYKKGRLGRWLMGVCGGYAPGSLEHDGCVFSQMQEYDPALAHRQAQALVAQLCPAPSTPAPEPTRPTSVFMDLVLLEHAFWDRDALILDLEDRWGIPVQPEEAGREDTLLLDVPGARLVLAMKPTPIPGGEAEAAAARNPHWPQGRAQAGLHSAHLIAAALSRGGSALDAAKLLVQVVCSLCRQPGTLGVYTNGIVYQPQRYLEYAQGLEEGALPLHDLVWVHLLHTEDSVSGITCGLAALGFEELEIVQSTADPEQVRQLLACAARRVLTQNQPLQPGSTVGLTDEQQFPVSRGPAVNGRGTTCKIQL